MKTIKKYFGALILFALLFAVVAHAKEGSISWYCKRNKEHKQPLADPELRVVERYDGYYIDHRHNDDAADKVIYLTFDAGYENGNVARILDVLKEEQVPGAFFVLKNLILKNGDLISRMINEGHLVCNHTATHKDMTKCTSLEEFRTELESLEKIYLDATGMRLSPYYRPPEGRFNESSLRYAKEMGYKTVFWSFAYADWDNDRQMSPEEAKRKILMHAHNGEVMLLHPTSATNAAILRDVIRALKQEGYRFGTLDELTAA